MVGSIKTSITATVALCMFLFRSNVFPISVLQHCKPIAIFLTYCLMPKKLMGSNVGRPESARLKHNSGLGSGVSRQRNSAQADGASLPAGARVEGTVGTVGDSG